MANIDISYLKNKLSKYGITFENFQYQTGNLVGRVIVPNALRAYNKELTAEEAFYFVANKVFESANLLAFGIPVRLQDCYEKVVSYDDFKDFQKAIYEEINQRFLSNTFPEFQNAGSVSLSNVNIQNGYLGGQLITDWVNPVSRQIIANIDWRQYDNDADIERDKVYMYRSMENAWLPTSENKRVIMALEDGSVGLVNEQEFAKQSDLELAGKQIKENIKEQIKNADNINEIKEQLPLLATKEFVEQVGMAFPKCEEWNPNKIYQIPAFVAHAGSIYWNNIEDNLNNVPGGITGEGKWIKMTDIFVSPKVSSIIYEPATDFKYSYSNPNPLYYVNIFDLLRINDLNEDSLFNYLDNNFPHCNLKREEVNNFYQNLCNANNDLLQSTYGKKIKFAKNSIKSFDNLDDLNIFITNNKLTNDDYQLINENKYLRFANESTLIKEGGSNLIKQSDFPNIESSFTLHDMIQSPGFNYEATGNFSWDLSQRLRVNPFDSDKNYDNGYNIYNGSKLIFKLNGGVDQTQFEPEYYSIYALKFKRDIYHNQINVYTNICKMSLEGKLIKNTNDGEQIDNQDYIFVKRKRKAKNNEFDIYTLETISGITMNVPDSKTLKEYIDSILSLNNNLEIKKDIQTIKENLNNKTNTNTWLDGVSTINNTVTRFTFISPNGAPTEDYFNIYPQSVNFLTGGRAIGDGFSLAKYDYVEKVKNELQNNLDNINNELNDYYTKEAVDNLINEKSGKNTWLNGLTSTDIENAYATELSYYLPNGNITPYVRYDFINRNFWSGTKSPFTTSFFIYKEETDKVSTELESFVYDCAYINNLETNLTNQIANVNYKLNNDYMTSDDIIALQQVQDTKIKELENRLNTLGTKFYKGQIILFDTEQDFINNLKNPLNLSINKDYIILDYDKYLITGSNGSTGGSTKLERAHLPNINLSHDHNYHFGGGSGGTKGARDGYSGCKNAYTTQVDSTNLYLNGNVTQKNYWPIYKTIYAIKFLRNI